MTLQLIMAGSFLFCFALLPLVYLVVLKGDEHTARLVALIDAFRKFLRPKK